MHVAPHADISNDCSISQLVVYKCHKLPQITIEVSNFTHNLIGKKKTEKVSFYGVCMYVRPKLTFVSFYFCFFCTFPLLVNVFQLEYMLFNQKIDRNKKTAQIRIMSPLPQMERFDQAGHTGCFFDWSHTKKF